MDVTGGPTIQNVTEGEGGGEQALVAAAPQPGVCLALIYIIIIIIYA